MFCKFCGANNPEGMNVCSACGSVIGSGDEVVVDNTPVQPVQPTRPVQPIQPVYPAQNPVASDDEVVSFGDWFLSIFLMKIPLVNLIISLVFAFSSNTKKSKSNFFKANLVWMLISTVLTILFGVFMATVGFAIVEDIYDELMWGGYMW